MEKLTDDYSMEILKLIYNFEDIVGYAYSNNDYYLAFGDLNVGKNTLLITVMAENETENTFVFHAGTKKENCSLTSHAVLGKVGWDDEKVEIVGSHNIDGTGGNRFSVNSLFSCTTILFS